MLGTIHNGRPHQGGGGRGVSPKADIAGRLRGFTLIDLAKMQTRGEGVKKNPKILRTSFMYGPLPRLRGVLEFSPSRPLSFHYHFNHGEMTLAVAARTLSPVIQ